MNKAITDGAHLMPPDFAQAPDAFCAGDGTPGSPCLGAHARIVCDDPDFGSCLELEKFDATQKLRYMGETPLLPGCYLRISARVKAVRGALPSVRIAGFAGGAGGVAVMGVQGTGPTLALDDHGEITEVSAIVGPGARGGVDMVWGREAIYGHFGLDLTGATGGVIRIESLVIEDVTGVFLRDLLPMVDVRDFGAQGDGETGDSDAFEAADAAAGGRMLLVPRGVFHLERDVRLEAQVVFDGQIVMPEDAVLLLAGRFDLAAYAQAFGDDATGLRRGLQALVAAPDRHRFDLQGRQVLLGAPLQVSPPKVQSAAATRKVICNGELVAQPSEAWARVTCHAGATWWELAPNVLSDVAEFHQIAIGTQVTGEGVGPQAYVCGKDRETRTLRLNVPLAGVAGRRDLTFTRPHYLLDFSEWPEAWNITLARLQFDGGGLASGVMLAPTGAGFRLQDCAITQTGDRALTSCGIGCAGLALDRVDVLCQQGTGLNTSADGVRLTQSQIRGPGGLAHMAGSQSLVMGCHFEGTTPQAEVILAEPAAITGTHFQSCKVRTVDGHPVNPPAGNIVSGTASG